jgi:prolyl 4-hydroxylase
MKRECAPACHSCDTLSFALRCPLPDNMDESNVWKEPTDLDDMFERIITDPKYAKYTPTVLSGPARHLNNNLTQGGPWVLVLDDFLTRAECERLIDLGATQGYERSKDVGDKQFDGTYSASMPVTRTRWWATCMRECKS